jgi:hypothetical protein
MCSFAPGFAVPIPTLLPETEIGELPIVVVAGLELVAVIIGTLFTAPVPCTVCAVPNAVIHKQNPTTGAKLDRLLLKNMLRSF